MASLNDNLFTTLVNHANPREFGCYLQTRWGTLKINISGDGLEAITFGDKPRPEVDYDSVFRKAFLEWVSGFESMIHDDQWRCLAPHGTEFQQQVWRALLEVPVGKQVNYKAIATAIGQPAASRAVGSAIAANPIALLIPCHRVVPASGAPGNYRWGSDRKLALLEAEQASSATLHQLFE